MQKFNKELLFNYTPSIETYKLSMLVTEKLGKLNVRLAKIFDDYKQPSRIFTFIESKYSSKIEGIYTTLFDVVNTGKETRQQKRIRPIVEALFKPATTIQIDEIKQIEELINTNVDRAKRWDADFGIGKREIIYQPPLDPNEVENLLKVIMDKSAKDENIIEMMHTHILFEKIHPFVDGNGRIGRLIFQKSLSKLTNFAYVLPVSWALFKKKNNYYDIFDIKTNSDIDKGIQEFLNIILFMYKRTKQFTIDLQKYINKSFEILNNLSFRIKDEIVKDILFALQTQSFYLQRKYKLNPRTIDSFFDKANENDVPFNRKNVSNKIMYWNIKLEELIDKYFN